MSSSWLALSSLPAKSEPMSSSSLSCFLVCRDEVRGISAGRSVSEGRGSTHSFLLVVKVVGDRVSERQLSIAYAVELKTKARGGHVSAGGRLQALLKTYDALGLDGVLFELKQLREENAASV